MTRIQWLIAILAFGAAPATWGQVQIEQSGDRIHVSINGNLYGDLVYGADVPKPYFYPLRSATGTIVTRGYPMEEVPGESRDHLHHRGLWIGHIDVNGFDFWSNEASYHQKNSGSIVLRKIVKLQGGQRSGFIHILFDWVSPSGDVLLTEDRTMTFYAESGIRRLDMDILFKAKEKVTFKDVKDGLLGIRVADALTETMGKGRIENARGAKGMGQVWGQPSNWVNYRGLIDGVPVGIAIFDHPSNYGHPVRWHARDYGLLGPNPFGVQAFDSQIPSRDFVMEPRQVLFLRYRVLVHAGLSTEAIGKLYEEYVNTGLLKTPLDRHSR